jgi:hypothetical protein
MRLPQKLSEALKASTDVPGETVDRLLAMATNAEQHPRLVNVVRADRAPTGRARCQGCREAIEKGAWRIVLERMDEGISSGGGFMHPACAAKEISADALLERLSYCEPPLTDDEREQLRSQLMIS